MGRNSPSPWKRLQPAGRLLLDREKGTGAKINPASSRKYLWKKAAIFRTCYSQKFPEKAPKAQTC